MITKENIWLVILLTTMLVFILISGCTTANERNPDRDIIREIRVICDGWGGVDPNVLCEGLRELDGYELAVKQQTKYLEDLYKNTFKL